MSSPNSVMHVCPHHVGHLLGMDIHDTPSISSSEALQPGSVFPLEPGFYFPTTSHPSPIIDKVHTDFRGLGMRLEDDFAILPALKGDDESADDIFMGKSEGELLCLSDNLARTADEIEEACRGEYVVPY